MRGTLGLGLAAATLPAGALVGASCVGVPQAGAAPTQAGPILTRIIPRTSEALPAIGLGTFLTFDTIPGQKRDHLREVLRRFWEAGGRVVDTSPLYGTAEISVGDFAVALDIGDRLFFANKIWSTGEYLADESHARRSLETSEGRLWRERIDLMQVHSLVNVDVMLPYLRAWKREGRIRYAGVTHFENPYMGLLQSWVERGDLDFVQVNYSIFNRQAEERLLPAAADRGAAVLVNMPFEKARLFKIVEGRPLPDFAREIGAETWAQFFLKWVVAHPAVTCVLPATSSPDHVAQNMAALRGPLPDREMRARMVRHMETLPGFGQIARMPWYPDKRYQGVIGRAQGALRARGG
ncbi:aldo/keto reductase [Sorangium sp. So ce341]|uniref:aldo/keto reductase n=1 Tax=Sorangium sp. So ce341 TaxID=3133302 RepID=UPI003F63F42F